jgi:hypothetical protein
VLGGCLIAKSTFMDSFNITITIQDQPISLTLQPEGTADYKVIFHDMLVGEIVKSQESGAWEELPLDQVTPGIYKMYEHHDSNTPKVMLDEKTIQEIGNEIDRKAQS